MFYSIKSEKLWCVLNVNASDGHAMHTIIAENKLEAFFCNQAEGSGYFDSEEQESYAAKEAMTAFLAATRPTRKVFHEQFNVGKAKYCISYHDGSDRHKDGSPFYGIHTSASKKDHEAFVTRLRKDGYIMRSNVLDAYLPVDEGCPGAIKLKIDWITVYLQPLLEDMTIYKPYLPDNCFLITEKNRPEGKVKNIAEMAPMVIWEFIDGVLWERKLTDYRDEVYHYQTIIPKSMEDFTDTYCVEYSISEIIERNLADHAIQRQKAVDYYSTSNEYPWKD